MANPTECNGFSRVGLILRSVAALGVSVAVPACNPFAGFDRRTEHTNLTYEEYISRVVNKGHDPKGALKEFDPKGASRIDYYCWKYRDGYDQFLRLSIKPSAYRSLLARTFDHLADPQRAAYLAAPVGEVTRTTTERIALPPDWPRPWDDAPDWWDLPCRNGKVECTRWELQCESRAKGWYWVYRPEAKMLWIWEWNHQWHSFDSKRAAGQSGAHGDEPMSDGQTENAIRSNLAPDGTEGASQDLQPPPSLPIP